jgi:hypothetical protein
MGVPVLQLTQGLTIRRLDEREVSKYRDGAITHNVHDLLHRQQISEFVIEGDLPGRKIMHRQKVEHPGAQEIAYSKLDKIILSLRTLKEGPVAYDSVHFRFPGFCPIALASYTSLDRHILPGTYTLSEEEAAALPAHTERIFLLREPALETACARLAESEARLRPQDQLLDAVIGMEALLLAGLDKDDRRGELKFRFSLNYSTCFNTPEERWRAYRLAKDLYDHRSTIAHGGDVAQKALRVGDEKLNLNDAARRAKKALRMLIKHFLPEAEKAPYKQPQFWEKAYFVAAKLRLSI